MSERGTFSFSMPHSACVGVGHRQPARLARRRRRAACTGCRGRARTSRRTCSRSTAGANGRNDSRNLIFRFITDCIFGERASPMIERPPSARGPNSMRPWTRPIDLAVGEQRGDALGEHRRSSRSARSLRSSSHAAIVARRDAGRGTSPSSRRRTCGVPSRGRRACDVRHVRRFRR